jgi:hypothetical protein
MQAGQDLAWHVSVGDCFVLVPAACCAMHPLQTQQGVAHIEAGVSALRLAAGTACASGSSSALQQQQQQQQEWSLAGGSSTGSGLGSSAMDVAMAAAFPWRLRQVATVEVAPGVEAVNAALVLLDGQRVSAGAVFPGKLCDVDSEVSLMYPCFGRYRRSFAGSLRSVRVHLGPCVSTSSSVLGSDPWDSNSSNHQHCVSHKALRHCNRRAELMQNVVPGSLLWD